MKKFILKKLKYLQLKVQVQVHVFFVIFVALSSCGDLVKESDDGACNNAIDNRNYDKAISVCTSRKDKASAYMGKAGYDIINLLKSADSSAAAYAVPTNSSLCTDDVTGGAILNILQLSVTIIDDDTTRSDAIVSSRTNLDSASDLLQPYISELSNDELLLNTFALSYAMQLKQLELYDNASTTVLGYPSLVGGTSVSDLTCVAVANSTTDTDAKAKLKFRDGHLWSTERNYMQCYRLLKTIKDLDGSAQTNAFNNFKSWVAGGASGALPEPFATSVCGEISSLTIYLTKLTANIAKLTLSGDNTKAITNAKASTNALMIALGCPTS